MTETTTPEPNGRVTPRDLYTAVERVRLEGKDDLKLVEGRLTTAIEGVGARFERYTEGHQSKHDEAAAALRAVAALLETHLHDDDTSDKVKAARADARMAPIRSGWAFVERNWRLIVALVTLGAGTFLGARAGI